MSGHTDNEVLIDAPMDLVWDMTNDIESWTELFSEYSKAEIIEVRDGTIRFTLALHPDENGKIWSWVSARTPDYETRTVRSQRVETGPFKYMWIYWEYTQTDDGVLMRWVQDFEMKPVAPITDEAMQQRLNGNTKIQQALIKDKVEAAARATVS
ncbi:SRPBCC family protein [Kibdelosporangium phytohabitans]|uniref:Polyketide cyclase n=1 Tax=Kibdelosporangium phytohabitans TaxID=860235 RepID=A0A0N9I019_9PSEU|nr:SRPBCC family protein [Kibdelosporangium phytohabitans]ALG10913.1 polyketide cyclase [Kibdelosporangium phytohabitans]MBE1462104.1 aromatase [Kibdelosporangium phytohabitans]